MFQKLALLVTVVAATGVGAATAHAANARTWVSGTGTSNSTCSRTEPCALFSQALAVTASGGEIDCLDPGSFGTVTINTPLTIDCEGASNGGITVTGAESAGISVTATGGVNLIGLDISSNGNTLDFGVSIGAAAANVTVRNCKIYGFNAGILMNAGTLVADNVLITNNVYGIENLSTSGAANLTVRNSTISNNGNGISLTLGGGTHAGATIEQTTLAFNDTGLQVQNAGAIALIGSSTVVNNGTGVSQSSGGVIYSFKNNQIGGNSTDGTPLTAYPGGPLN